MSRRKQSNPRQIKRSLAAMEEGEDAPVGDRSPSERDGAASDCEGSAERDTCSPPGSEESGDALESPKEPEEPGDPGEKPREADSWNGPDELALEVQDGQRQLRTRRSLPEGFSWGPFQGSIHSEPASPGRGATSPPVTLVLGDESCWLSHLPLVPGEPDANAVIYRKDEALWCRTTRALREDEPLSALVVAEPPAVPKHGVKAEPGESPYPAALHSDIQLLPQQAGMAAILATAVVNKDVFPCKDCGIWYRSERNLQAHLMYYCASRQSAGSPALEEKPKETYPNERVCPFPQCKKSCPSASSLEIHMRSHSGERPFVCLICLSAFTTKANCERHLKVHTDTLNGVCHSCGFISTTRDILYSHLVTNHMICQPGSKGEVFSPGSALPAAKPLAPGLSQPNNASLRKCSLSAFLPEALPALPQHVVLPGPDSAPVPAPAPAPPASPPDPRAGKLSPPAQPQNGEGPSSSSCSSSSSGEPVRIKEEPAGSPGSEAEAPRSGEGAGSPQPGSRTSSPRSLASAKVKSELASPTPGSSPVPSEPGAGAAGGTVFLPQYVFGHEAAAVPQASEILAKMSELVHSRLKQGHGGGAVPPAIYAGTPVPKGATCFECEITFNNINNYYVHKRLYCSSRHLAEDSPPGQQRKLKAPPGLPKGPPAPGTLLSPPAGNGQGLAAGDGDAGRDATPPATAPEGKAEEGGTKAGSPEVEGGSGRCSEDSQSPASSAGDEGDEDPSKTLCEACNIRFSRHETYVVHKRFYCASRHDPPLRRPCAPKVPFVPQPLRTRKRRKLYEIHGAARRHAEPPPEPPPPAEPPVVSSEPRASPDAEGPIDLSKKPRWQSEPTPAPAPAPAPLLPLADYHECTACRISFNSLDAYLAHKKYQCPATPLQPRTLEHLQKMKGAMGAPLKGRHSPGSPGEGDPEGGLRVRAAPAASPGVPYPAADSLQRHPKAPLLPAGAKGPLAACPYCPLNGAIKGDLLEHFRNAHGLFVAKPPSGSGQGLPDALAPAAGPGRTPEPPLPTASPPGPRLRRDSAKEGRDSPGSPRAPSSPGAPEALRESREPPTPPAYTDRAVQTPPGKAVPGPVPNGNHRYCRLCNIKFSSLSTFIAHKKYYCSSHAAEHVK
ncbi:zinc finger protein ZFPM1 isoform X2 [Oenanthe melanoleuca]|uniref:zinc finger protein ZFPM1 isoform X2 n=1 Tax=Oenanthe melanoleuca TaxID=2939378 RepID=UPI0024C136C7|nr:zinc finger protein ZFPM1 isoform X2 [Oenanthe melanoleuca]